MLVNYKVFYKQDGRLIAEKVFDTETDGHWAGQKWAATQGGWYLEAYQPDGAIYCTWLWQRSNCFDFETKESWHSWDWWQYTGNCRHRAEMRWPVDCSNFDSTEYPDDYFINKPRRSELHYRQRGAIRSA